MKLTDNRILEIAEQFDTTWQQIEYARAIESELQAQASEPVAEYSDIISDGGLDPRNKLQAQASEPVAIVEVGHLDFGPFIFDPTPYGIDHLADGKHNLYTTPQPTAQASEPSGYIHFGKTYPTKQWGSDTPYYTTPQPAECPTCFNPPKGQPAPTQNGTAAPCPRCAELGSRLRAAQRAIHTAEVGEKETKRLCDIFETQRNDSLTEIKALNSDIKALQARCAEQTENVRISKELAVFNKQEAEKQYERANAAEARCADQKFKLAEYKGRCVMSKCEVCGEDMPAGEEMFKFHGYSGDCPKPPLPRVSEAEEIETLRAEVAELRKDKERLKFVLDNPQTFEDIFEEVFYESGIAGANDEMKAVVLKRIDAAKLAAGKEVK